MPEFKDTYSESEAAGQLGISLEKLHDLLDTHVFNDGKEKPELLTFRFQDLVMLEFWYRAQPQKNIFRMPRR